MTMHRKLIETSWILWHFNMVYILCNKAQMKKLPEINNYCRLNVKKKKKIGNYVSLTVTSNDCSLFDNSFSRKSIETIVCNRKLNWWKWLRFPVNFNQIRSNRCQSVQINKLWSLAYLGLTVTRNYSIITELTNPFGSSLSTLRLPFQRLQLRRWRNSKGASASVYFAIMPFTCQYLFQKVYDHFQAVLMRP